MKKISSIILLLIFCCFLNKIAFSGDATTWFYLNGIAEPFPNVAEISKFKLDGIYQDNQRVDYKDNKNRLYICELYSRSKEQLHKIPGELKKIENIENIYEFISVMALSSPSLCIVGFKNEKFIMISVYITTDKKIDNEIKNNAVELMKNLLQKI
jgi:hypothetical protein